MKDSPFDSPLTPKERIDRRATVLPTFKSFCEQATQTSYENSSKRNENLFNNESSNQRSIFENRMECRSTCDLNESNEKSVNRSHETSIKSNKFNKSLSRSTNKLVQKSLTNSIKNFEKSKLKDVSNVTNQRSIEKSKNKEKRKSNRLYDKSNYISFSLAHVYEPDDVEETIKNNVQTELIESLIEDSTFKNLNLNSLIGKKSIDLSITKLSDGQTKNYTGSFTDQTKSTNKTQASKNSNLIPLDSPVLKMNSEKSLDKNLSIKSKNKSIDKSKQSMIKRINDTTKSNENELKKSVLKKSVQVVNTNDNQTEFSLVFDSTKTRDNINFSKNTKSNSINEIENKDDVQDDLNESLKELDKNLEQNDLSIINSVESEFEIVFDDESLDVNSKLNEEIELVRKSITNQSIPEISTASASISESITQPESNKSENIENETLKNKTQEKMNLEQSELSIEFNSDEEIESESNQKLSDYKQSNSDFKQQQLSINKSTPKSILKNSKRIWDVSDFSLVDLTVGSPSMDKSTSNQRNQKNNSVRFSDKLSEKFKSNLLLSSSKKGEQSKNISNEKNVELSGKSISKSLNDSINKSLNESFIKLADKESTNKELSKCTTKESITSNQTANDLPDLDCSFEIGSNKEADSFDESEESLNITIDEISENDELKSQHEDDVEQKSENDDNEHTPINCEPSKYDTFTVKSIKKPIRKKQFKNIGANKKLQRYYETFVDKTPTIIYPDNDEQDDSTVRRSNRIRVRPLDWWRLQKPKYKLDNLTKCLTIEGIDKGFKVDNPFKKKRTRTLNQKSKKLKKSKDKKLIKRKHYESLDSEEDDKESEQEIKIKKRRYSPNEVSIHQQLNNTAIALSEKIKAEASEFCTQNDLKWTESKQSKGVHIAFMSRKKDPNGNTQATGFMKLESLLKKPVQRSANYVTRYVVMFGAASVVIDNKSPVILKSMDSFVVNKNTLFSIDNLRTDELLLYFDVTKN